MPIGPAEKSSEKGQRHQLRRPFSPVRFRSKNRRICGKFLGFPPHGGTPSLLLRLRGGGRGIRTPGTLSGTAVFKTARFDRSRIPPRQTSGDFSPVYNSHPAFRGGSGCTAVATHGVQGPSSAHTSRNILHS